MKIVLETKGVLEPKRLQFEPHLWESGAKCFNLSLP